MNYDVFQSKVNNLLSRIDSGIVAAFSHDENGRHIAECSDGTVITGNAKSLKVTICWGSGHTAMAAI